MQGLIKFIPIFLVVDATFRHPEGTRPSRGQASFPDSAISMSSCPQCNGGECPFEIAYKTPSKLFCQCRKDGTNMSKWDRLT